MKSNPQAILAESLLRIEHKLDTLLRMLQPEREDVLSMRSPLNSCPVCLLPVELSVDFQNQVPIRKCGCSSGKVIVEIPEVEISVERTRPGGDLAALAADLAEDAAKTKKR